MGASKKRKEQRKHLHCAPNATCEEIAMLNSDCMLFKEKTDMSASIQGFPIRENSDVQLRSVEGKGQGLFWCPSDGKPLAKGTTFLRLQPEMMVPDEHHILHNCHVCYSTMNAKGGPLLCCPGCKLVRYCSATCERGDKDLHQEECKALSLYSDYTIHNAKEVPDPGMMVRQLARLVWKRNQMGKAWWKNIEALLVHYDERKDSPTHYPAAVLLADYLCGEVLGSDKDDALHRLGYPSFQELQGIHARLTYNSFNATSNKQKVGTALSTIAAMINHSCTPNAKIVWSSEADTKKPLRIVSLLELKAGDEITITYIDTRKSYETRQSELQEQYFFQCRCPLCFREHLGYPRDQSAG